MSKVIDSLEKLNFIDFKDVDYIFSLSHTDLDGYGAQTVIENSLDVSLGLKIEYINANYGEVNQKLKYIIRKILKDKLKKYVILITDLGLDEKQAAKVSDFVNGNSNIDIKIQLLDHHKTHIHLVKKYDWYYVDTTRCATKIMYDYLGYSPYIEVDKDLEFMVKLINIYDLWKEDVEDFGKSNFMANTIFTFLPNYPQIVKKHQVYHYMYIIYELAKRLKNDTVQNVQKDIFNVCNDYYMNFIEDNYSKDDNMSTEARFYRHLYLLTISEYKHFEKFNIEDKVFKVLYDYGDGFQNVSKYILSEIGDVDFLVLVSKTYRVSIRGSKFMDVSKIAEKYFNGGGHKEAAGGKLVVDKGEVIRNQKSLETFFRENF